MVDNKIYGRFWTKVVKTETCWIWSARITKNGYGQFKINYKSLLAHRVAWELINASENLLEKVCVLHKCDNRKCVNPKHLFLGTVKDNNRDRKQKDRSANGNRNGSRLYPEKLIRGEKHWNAKLTEQDVKDIRTIYKIGNVTQSFLAKKYGVYQTLISDIINKKKWKHVL